MAEFGQCEWVDNTLGRLCRLHAVLGLEEIVQTVPPPAGLHFLRRQQKVPVADLLRPQAIVANHRRQGLFQKVYRIVNCALLRIVLSQQLVKLTVVNVAFLSITSTQP